MKIPKLNTRRIDVDELAMLVLGLNPNDDASHDADLCKPDVFEQTYEKVEDGGTPTFPFWGDVPTRIPITSNDTVPYYTICQCNPANGGSGVCGCTMGQTMVPNPGVTVFENSYVKISTSDSTNTSNGNN